MSVMRFVRMIALASSLVVALAAPAAAEATGTATITVVHAVPGEDGFPADLYLNGELVIGSIVFDAISEPIEVDAGPVDVALFEAGANPASTQPVLAQQVTLEADSSYTMVAQLIDGTPAAALYLNDIEPVDTGLARVTIRHTGSGGPLSVALGAENVVADLMSPNEVTVEVPAGVLPLSVAAADGMELIEQDVDFRAGSLLVLYAVGGTEGAQFGLLTQQVTIPQVAPTGVPTGTGGEMAGRTHPAWLLAPALFVILALAALRPRRSAPG